MPALYDPAQVERLIGTCQHLSDDLEDHKLALKATDKRSHAARRAATVGIVVAIVGIIAATTGISYGRQAQRTADKVNAFAAATTAERSSQIVASCIQFNAQRFETREAMKLALSSLAPPTAQQTDQQRAALETYSKSVDLGLPYRDCSPAGIDAYFKSPPKDPAAH